MDGLIGRWMDRRMDEWRGRWTEVRMDGWMHRQTDGWIDGWVGTRAAKTFRDGRSINQTLPATSAVSSSYEHASV